MYTYLCVYVINLSVLKSEDKQEDKMDKIKRICNRCIDKPLGNKYNISLES